MQLVLWHKQKLSSIITLCMVVVVILVCARLGFWQLQRAEQKQQQLTAIEKLQTRGVMSWQQLLNLPSNWNKTGVLAELTGLFVQDQYWLLDNQVYNGQVGYDLLVLFKPADKSQTILVNLGWIKSPPSRDELPKIDLPSNRFTLIAQIKENNLSGFTLESKTAPLNIRIQNIDLDKLSQKSQQSLVNFMAYRQGEGDKLATPHYKAVVMSPQKHHAYAVQWFLIAIACVVVAVFASKKRAHNEK